MLCNDKLEVYSYFAFLYEIIIWAGEKNKAETINNIDLLIIPLNKKTTDGIIDNANALNIVFFLKQIVHIKQYIMIRIIFTIR